jgi:hypothetical protein
MNPDRNRNRKTLTYFLYQSKVPGMEASSPLHPAIDLATHLYYQLVYTLTDLLPPPLDDTQEGLRARNHAAIAQVAALLTVNANQIDLAAQCIAARARAKQMLRLLRQHAAAIVLVMRLNAPYGSMVRTSLAVFARLLRVQALRQKRQAIDGAANQDARAQHVAERSMLLVADPDAEPQQAAIAQSGTGRDAGRAAGGSRGPKRFGKHLRKSDKFSGRGF